MLVFLPSDFRLRAQIVLHVLGKLEDTVQAVLNLDPEALGILHGVRQAAELHEPPGAPRKFAGQRSAKSSVSYGRARASKETSKQACKGSPNLPNHFEFSRQHATEEALAWS
ncbi:MULTISPECIES: hypothetical protein [unclassified Streptomyces]|uniref:hypothetical protein n=1 Tax=unclassified Streptomyces TaxID=2593676 RepID=UPI0033AAADFC